MQIKYLLNGPHPTLPIRVEGVILKGKFLPLLGGDARGGLCYEITYH